jgi:hypothetical protein
MRHPDRPFHFGGFAQQFRQLADVGRDPSRLPPLVLLQRHVCQVLLKLNWQLLTAIISINYAHLDLVI